MEHTPCKALRSREDTYEGKLDEPSGYLKTRKNISMRNRKIETITESSPQKLTAAEGGKMFDLIRWLKPMDGCIMRDWVLPATLIVCLLYTRPC